MPGLTPHLLVGSVLSAWVNPRFIGRVCVAHLLILFVLFFALFVFVLCLVSAMLPMSPGLSILVPNVADVSWIVHS